MKKSVGLFFILFWVFSSIGLAQENRTIVPIVTPLPDENPTQIASIIPEHQQFASPDRVHGETITIPIKVKGSWGKEKTLRLKATLHMPEGEGPFPLAVYSHGSVYKGQKDEVLKMHSSMVRDLTSRGFAVITPMRRGRGGSEGSLGTTQYKCDASKTGLENGIEDINGVIDYMKGFPRINASEILMIGKSRGGVLSVEYAERYPDNVIGGVNFAGGWWNTKKSDQKCIDFDNARFDRKEGSKFNKNTFWAYGANDTISPKEKGESYHRKYTEKGGMADLFTYPATHSGWGRGIITKYDLYRKDFDEYMTEMGYPKKAMLTKDISPFRQKQLEKQRQQDLAE